MKYLKEIRERFNNPEVPVFRMSELRLTKGISDSYLKLLVHNLLRKGEIRRITKGVYTFHNNADVVCYAFMPAYYGLEDALSIRRISEQGTNPTVITMRNVRRGVRGFAGKNYQIYHIDKRLFFGYDLIKRGDLWIPVSDVEKTMIDMVYFGIYIRDELRSEIMRNMSRKKLENYLKHYNKKVKERVHEELQRQKHHTK